MTSFLFSNSSYYQDALALVDSDSGESLSFAEFKSTVIKLAHSFLRLGIRKDDVVMIFAPNSIRFPLCFLAITAVGAIATTVNPMYTVRELSKQVQDSKPKLIVTVSQLLEKLQSFNLPIVLFNSEQRTHDLASKEVYSFDDFLSLSGNVKQFPDVPIKQSDTAALLYSSGTTGTSKGVILTHGNFITASQMVVADQDAAGEKHNKFLCVLPMFHVFGLSILLYAQLQRGNSIVSMAKFDFGELLKNIEKYKVTNLWVVPPIILALAKQGVVNKFDLSSLRQIGSGAAPLGKDLMQECAKNFPQAVIMQVISQDLSN